VEPQSADLDLLKLIAAAFSHLPYENVTKILKHSRSMDSQLQLRRTGEVLEDHLRWNTGGTCFSLCNALLEVLKQNEFDAFIAMGDMHYGTNIHCAVIVRLSDQPYLLDPGYLLHQPIPLLQNGHKVSIRTSMNTVTLKEEERGVVSLYTEESGRQKWRYRLRIIPTDSAEFEKHWIHSFSLNSMETILLSRINETGRIYFRKDRLENVSPIARKKTIVSPDDVKSLSEVFGLPVDLITLAQHSLIGRR
jgi:arylamine N-acetyltransferase